MDGQGIQGWDIVAALLAAFGVSTTGIDFLGGLALGMAGAMAASRIIAAGMVPNAKSLGVFATFLTGAFVSIVSAMIAQWAFPSMLVQLPMAVGGFLSSLLAPFALRLFQRVLGRSDEVADCVLDRVLPEEDGDSGD